MYKSVKTRAEEQFTATQKKNKRALNEKEKARRERAEHVAKLRPLRLAKEAKEKARLEGTERVVRLRALRLAKGAADKEAAENVYLRSPSVSSIAPSLEEKPSAKRSAMRFLTDWGIVLGAALFATAVMVMFF